jgi:GNAT superfamily N-acetyltransferase
MADIRPLERSDLPAVVELLKANLPLWVPENQMLDSLAAALIDHPWVDERLPSLVAMDEDGKLIGFIAAHVRRLRFEDRELRAVCCSHLTVAPGRRGGAAGALLLRRLLTSGQDLTFSDTANAEVSRMWQTFGGHLDHARACDWMVVLRPIRWLRVLATDVVLRRDLGRGQIPVGAFPFQAVRRRSGRWAFPEPDPDVIGEDVDAANIVERLPEITRGFRLRVDYGEEFLDHLFGQVESQFGRLTKRLVRRGDRPLGWYAYVPNRRGVSRVMHLLTPTLDIDADAVLGDLVAHARAEGSTVLAGRHEPHLTETLQRRLPVLGFAQRPVIHCHDPEILATLATGSSLLTRLDGEWFVS